ncbi:MAG: hypothetical protein GY854_18480, partial [Deltaproteobacteria bacterium]|nr:hypothetical protein [Deltaproteobacteria bacterium]
RVIVTATDPPLPGTEVRLTLRPPAVRDLFLNELAEPFQQTFTWPEEGAARAILVDETPPAVDEVVLRDGHLEVTLSEEPDMGLVGSAFLVDGGAISSALSWRLAAVFVAMDRNTPGSVAAWINLLFVAALSVSFVLLAILVSSFPSLFRRRFVPILGAALGVVPNCCYWCYVTMDHFDWQPPFLFDFLGTTGTLLGAPGGYLAFLRDPNFTLFHSHLRNATLVDNWIIVTFLNVISWSIVVGVIEYSTERIRERIRNRSKCPQARNDS